MRSGLPRSSASARSGSSCSSELRLAPQSTRGLSELSKRNTSPRLFAYASIASISWWFQASAIVLSVSGIPRATRRSIPSMHLSKEPGTRVTRSYVSRVMP